MQRVSINRLQPGLFISLSHVGWVRHPFLLNEFRISSEKQIQVLKEMGLEDVPWDPQRSTTVPLPEVARSAAPEEVDFGAAALAGMLEEVLLDDPEELHLALAPQAKAGQAAVVGMPARSILSLMAKGTPYSGSLLRSPLRTTMLEASSTVPAASGRAVVR